MDARQQTPQQVKESFVNRGETIASWADRHGFPRDAVYALLAGRVRGNRGLSHAIAVALGLKSLPTSSLSIEHDDTTNR